MATPSFRFESTKGQIFAFREDTYVIPPESEDPEAKNLLALRTGKGNVTIAYSVCSVLYFTVIEFNCCGQVKAKDPTKRVTYNTSRPSLTQCRDQCWTTPGNQFV